MLGRRLRVHLWHVESATRPFSANTLARAIATRPPCMADRARRQADNDSRGSKGPPPTIDQATIAKQKARKEAKKRSKEVKEAKLLASLSPEERQRHLEEKRENEGKNGPKSQDELFRKRSWIPVGTRQAHETGQDRIAIKVITWNMLAQTLVRRELFPGSDCLRWKDRASALAAELTSFGADILALQEVDKFKEAHQGTLEQGGYAFRQARGSGRKRHGLVIAWRKDSFEFLDEAIVRFDEHTTTWGRSTRVTNNCALLVALRTRSSKPLQQKTLIVSTTHLHWHPKTIFERARQGGIILSSLAAFRARLNLSERTTCLLCGDLNAQPSEALYKLLVGRLLSQGDLVGLEESRKIHHSIDRLRRQENRGPEDTAADNDEEEEGQGDIDPDKELASIRQVEDQDGILEVASLVAQFKALAAEEDRSIESVYGTHYGTCREVGREELWSSRADEDRNLPSHEKSADHPSEPIWTNFTPLWRLTLDYIFVLEKRSGQDKTETRDLLHLLTTEEIEPGLPRLGITASDHISIGCTLSLRGQD